MLPENVKVKLESIASLDGHNEKMQNEYNAKCFLKNGKIYLKYDEIMDGVDGAVNTLVTITENTFQISRSGGVKSTMRFVDQKELTSQYQSEVGLLEIRIKTNSYVCKLEEDSIDINLNYDMYMNGVESGNHIIKMFVK